MFIMTVIFTGVVVSASTYVISNALQKVKDSCNQDLLESKEKEIQLLVEQNNQLSRELSRYAAVYPIKCKEDYDVRDREITDGDNVMNITW